MTRRAEIAGAGFAGLTLAAALARRGWRVRVHEAGAELRDFGAGIFLWENGLKALESLGGAERVLAHSHQANQWEERDSRDAQIGVRPLPLPGGLRMVTLTRQDLYATMLDLARSAGVEFRVASRAVAAEPAGVLITEDGTRWPADLVAAADGIRSAVRESLGLQPEHEVFNFGMYRFLVPLDRAPGVDGQWRNYVNYWNLEQKRRVLYVPCNARDLYLNLGALDTDLDAIAQPLDPAVWCASFPVLEPVLADLPAAPRFDRYEVLRLPCWSVGRVAVVGDAAHAMPPTIGQGAGTAMMNALNLAIAVAESDDIPSALRTWEESERSITEDTQKTSVNVVGALIPQAGERRDDWTDAPLRPAQRVPRSEPDGARG